MSTNQKGDQVDDPRTADERKPTEVNDSELKEVPGYGGTDSGDDDDSDGAIPDYPIPPVED